ncbi:ATP synthase inhibitor protein INH1 [Phycomyces blakesleeanus]|uniref:ATPase inhibitor, mitochondrial n=2 Tax=Phycomyces blakesleeanus TaxID=4837 RepID=A0A167LHY0_PHYB8|nr:ATP synthase inhibitor protein INH1 [Phycomyces blakesleeanus NRRL 1555(-)]OAD70497.1 ATP synthase inhibitor protein INH1 [Phycomyces blakesleeanus NRRL 1555(-)]|eukprot:XP_018288537.1 ATP synthase inhibitor protein INH1 [Phycomyces blakesleeanus NRRL 1555(-)]
MFSKTISRIATRSTIRLPSRYTSTLSGAEGATASSKGAFGEKEKALENQWARAHDAEKIKLLREALKKQQEHTAELQKDIEALKNASKN